MRWLVDVNVVLDVLADREPWADASTEVLGRIERGEETGYLAAHTVTTLRYLLARHRGRGAARREVGLLLRLFEIVPVDEDRLLQALDLDLPDFEDGVQAACAEKVAVDALVTRNEDDFEGVGVAVLSPVALLSRADDRGRGDRGPSG